MDGRPSRRQFLAASVAGLAGLTGCNQLQSTPTGVTIIDAHISNLYSEPRTLSVAFERDGELVYWRQFHVDGTDPDADVQSGADIPLDSLGNDPAVWTVEVLNTNTGKHRIAEIAEARDSKVRLEIEINRNDRVVIQRSP